jgi:hypothetical protein
MIRAFAYTITTTVLDRAGWILSYRSASNMGGPTPLQFLHTDEKNLISSDFELVRTKRSQRGHLGGVNCVLVLNCQDGSQR